ncbi:MAG: LysR family transcriptional regulator, partial [Bdellovibrionales bacterium]|nr:LysR family transcriptional regulator [Bdellovibrionales bacterium]
VLFYRSRSGIKLTSSGKVFLTKAQNVLLAIDSLNIKNDGENIFGGRTIVIGCHPTVAQYSIPKSLLYLKANAPDFKIELKHDLSRNIQVEIQRGSIDIGIVVNPAEVPDLVIQKLAIDMVGVWSAKTDETLDTIICNLELFQTQSILKKWKNKPSKIISTDSLELICRLVAENIGYGIIPERAVRLSGAKIKSHMNLPIFKDEICLVYRPEFGKTLPEKMVISSLKNAIALSLKS